jgi:hypothetical protein
MNYRGFAKSVAARTSVAAVLAMTLSLSFVAAENASTSPAVDPTEPAIAPDAVQSAATIIRVGEAFLIKAPSRHGVVTVLGDGGPSGLHAVARVDGVAGEVRLTSENNVVTVDFGAYGIIAVAIDPASVPALVSPSLGDCRSLLASPLYQALAETLQATGGLDPEAAMLVQRTNNLLSTVVGFDPACGGGVPVTENSTLRECRHEHDLCRLDCDHRYSSWLTLWACYNNCSMEFESCAVCAILCPWHGSSSTVETETGD